MPSSSILDNNTNTINSKIIKINSENELLVEKLNKLQNHNSGAGGELKQKNYLYNQLLTQNIVLFGIILGASCAGVFMYKKRS